MSMDDKEEMQDVLEDAAEAGRGGDSMLAHVARGEIVLPVELATDPEIRALLEKKFKANDMKINRYVVGHRENSINPETGLPEYFSLKRLAGTIIGGAIGFFATGGTFAGAVKGAQIGAGIDATRAIADNAAAAREAAATAQATAIAEAQKARDQAAAEAQKARELTMQQLSESRASQSAALEQQRTDAAARLEQARLSAEQQRQLLTNLSAQQLAAADAAKATLAQQQQQYAEQKTAMERQAADQAAALDAERRKIAERESSQMAARRRAGRRALLSDTRLNPELGITATNPYGNQAVVMGA